ncbi:MAG: hypothetical protein WAO35_15615 [Terriglobia bacterium]
MNLQSVPGRKTVIMFSPGFLIMKPENMSELTAAIVACNRANVAIYTVDAQGLVPRGGGASSELLPPMFPHLPGELAFLAFPPDPAPQQGGGGGPGAGGGGSGGNPGAPAGTCTLPVSRTSTSASRSLKRQIELTLAVR